MCIWWVTFKDVQMGFQMAPKAFSEIFSGFMVTDVIWESQGHSRRSQKNSEEFKGLKKRFRKVSGIR